MKNILQVSILLFTLLLTNCKDNSLEIQQEVKSAVNYGYIGKTDIQKNNALTNKLELMKTEFTKKKDNKSVYSELYDFTIETDYAFYVESEDATQHSYTFPISRVENNENGLIENFILTLKEDGNYIAQYVSYNLTENEKIYSGNNENIDLTDQVIVTEVTDDFLIFEVLENKGGFGDTGPIVGGHWEYQEGHCENGFTQATCTNIDGHLTGGGWVFVIDFVYGDVPDNADGGSSNVDVDNDYNCCEGSGSTSSGNNINPNTTISTPISVNLSLISELYSYTEQALTPEQNLWFSNPNNSNHTEDILNYLESNPNSQEAIETVLEIIELSEDSPFNLNTEGLEENIKPLPQDNSPEAIKLRCIYKKLTQSPKFKSFFVDTFGENTDLNIKFEIVIFNPASNGETANGSTIIDNPPNIRDQTIKMDRSHLLSDHPLTTAQTIIHEALHAFINIKVAQCIDDPSTTTTFNDINELNQLTFDELLNDFALDCDVANLLDHRLMYNRMVNVMDEMLTEVLGDLVASEDSNPPFWMADDTQFNWDDAIHYLNLTGLHEAKEYIEDNIADPNIGLLVTDYSNKINNKYSQNFNHNTCN